MVTSPLNFLPISIVTRVDHTWYIRQWTFMNKVKMKGLFTIWVRWLHFYLYLIIPFGTSNLLIWMNLFVQMLKQHARHYRASAETLQTIKTYLWYVCINRSDGFSLVNQPFLIVSDKPFWSLKSIDISSNLVR